MSFLGFRAIIQAQVKKLLRQETLYVTDIDKDKLFKQPTLKSGGI
jgi:hypothetical protein